MAQPKHARPSATLSSQLRNILLHFAAYLVILLYCEFALYIRVQGSLQGFSLWILAFLPAEAMFFTFLSGWFNNGWPDRLLSTLIAALITAFYCSQAVYFQIFGSMYSLSMIGMGGDALGDFGWGMGSTIRSCIGILLILLIPVAIWGVGRFLWIRELNYLPLLHAGVAVVTAVLWLAAVLLLPLSGKGAASAYNAYHDALVDTDTAASKIGVLTNSAVEAARLVGNSISGGGGEELTDPTSFPTEPTEPEEPTLDTSPHVLSALDFDALKEKTKNKDIKSVCEYLAKQNGTARNEYTGLFKDCNLIYICAESFSTYAIDPVITPTLYKLANEGIVLENYYNAYKNTTTNGEFSFLTGLWPDVSRYAKMGTNKGSFAQSANNEMPMGMGKLFNEQRGITSRGYHNYKGSYYCREDTLPNLGFTCKFMGAGMNFTTSWPSSDLEMMEQSIDDYIGDEQFFAYYMTFSGHGPYTSENVMYNRNIKTVKELAGDRGYNDCAMGYFATNYELEKAMAYLLQRLEEAGKLDNTVIVLTGDHYPYYLNTQARDNIAGHAVEADFEAYHSTCTVWKGGMEPIKVSTPCCNVDILPTILNLFDIEYDSRLLCGTDIFSDAPHVAMLYNKSFITDDVKYNNATDKAIWNDTVTLTEEEKANKVSAMSDYVTNKYLLALKIVDTDFYGFVWENTDFDGTGATPDETPTENTTE